MWKKNVSVFDENIDSANGALYKNVSLLKQFYDFTKLIHVECTALQTIKFQSYDNDNLYGYYSMV